jgi:hypothetical protein
METKLDKGEFAVGYARIAGGVLVLTNIRLLIDRGFRVFGEKKKSILIKDITAVEFSKSFLFGTGIDIRYVDENRKHSIFAEFTIAPKAKEIEDKIWSIKRGEIPTPVEVPRGETGGISLEEAEQIALHFMEERAGSLKVEDIRHIAGAWNIVMSNQDRYAVIIGDDGKVEEWKKLTKTQELR